MKKLIATLSLAFAGVASAAGPFDGIYEHPLAEDTYISVHQNGNHVISTTYFSIRNGGIQFGPINGRNFTPKSIAIWQLAGGDLVNGVAYMSGESLFGACHGTFRVWLNNQGNLIVEPAAIVSTAEGLRQGISCNFPNPGTFVAPRIF